MKKTILILAAIIAMTVLSCSKQENGGGITPPSDGQEEVTYLKINSVTTSELTKAAIKDTKFPIDEEISIGLFLVGDGYTDAKYSNIEYTKPAGSDAWTDPQIELIEGKTATVYAYYPYDADVTDIEQIQAASSINGSDWMWATPIADVSVEKPAIDLSLNHALALVEITFNVYGPEATMTNVTVAGGEGAFTKAGTLDATQGTITPDTQLAASKTSPLSQDVNLQVADGKIVADCLLVPGKTGEAALARQDFYIKCTYNGKPLSASLTGDKGVIIRQGTKSTILLNIKDSDSKMEVVSVGVDEWNDKVSGNTAEVDGHTVTFNCPEGLKYSLHLEQETSGSFDEETSGTLKQVLTFSYDGSAPSLPQEKFLAVEGPASGCGYTFDKTAHTITVTDVTTDVSFNLSLGDITYITYTATAKVEPNNKKIGSLPLNEEKSTFNGNSGVMAIEGKLTAIGEYAFNGNTDLTGITLPDEITAIDISAFDECHNLVLPQLPNSVAYIGKYAFRRAGRDADQTTELVLPEDLTIIERYAFEECRIKTLTGNAKLETIWIGAFKKCTDLTAISFKGQTAPTIEEGSIFIETDLSKTSGIAVPKSNSHTSLLNYKKADWWKDIPNGIIREEGTTVTLIPYTASAKIILKTKDNPSEFSWGANTEYVSDDCCSRYDADSDEGEWFFIGEGSAVPTKIPAEMFKSADPIHPGPLQSITIPEGVIFIGKQAFYRCENLTSISFPATLETIEAYGTYPNGMGAFESCNYLTSIDLSGCSKLKEIPINCFSSCTRVTSLKLPEGLESIKEETFSQLGSASGGAGLQSLTLPASLTSLGFRSFEESKINSVTLYSNLKSIKKSTEAFYDSTVENLVFEDGSNPASTMFYNCLSLKTITSKSATPPDLCLSSIDETAETVFKNYSSTVYVPADYVDIYKAAPGWSKFGDNIKAIVQ